MYDYIKGIFTYKNINSKGCFATVEAGGIGYRLEMMERDYLNLPEESAEIKAFTVLIHREDKMNLCGFLRREDRDIFNILTSVSGVGSKMALTLLNSFKVSDLIGFVIDGDYREITKAKGVGPKLAQKIVLELKDKLSSYQGTSTDKTSIDKHISITDTNTEDAKNVLLSLGYEKDEVKNAIEKATTSLPQKSTAEEILKKSLQLLSL